MIKFNIKGKSITLENAKINMAPAELVEIIIREGGAELTDTGALMLDTGTFTGRSPKDRFIVEDDKTKDTVHWGDINIPISTEKYESLKERMISYLGQHDFENNIYVRDCYACSDPKYRLPIQFYGTKAWQDIFCHNMFRRYTDSELRDLYYDGSEFTIICIPEFEADPEVDGTRNKNFSIINLTERVILIGGTEYGGEIKKGIFSVLNYILPEERGILSMHCSANVGMENDTALFFGLSGTGKTTLSTDPRRSLIGDDEHAWTDRNVFNFEGGCYAKVYDIKPDTEPGIYNAIKFGSVLENTRFMGNSRRVNYLNREVTRNTRVSYPINHIDNIHDSDEGGGIPKNIFLLTADRLGIIPPISLLTPGQAMYHFISGYTAKVAGTEVGVEDPTLVFSACYGEPFLPLHPAKYATMLGDKLKKHNIKVWLVNTGWTGGSYGDGDRIKLKYTRELVNRAMNNQFDCQFETEKVFGLSVPQFCIGVPHSILNPRDTWKDKEAYDQQAVVLAEEFRKNFEKYADEASEETKNGGPIL